MRRISVLFVLIICSLVGFGQKTDIQMTVKDLGNQSVILGYYYNKQILVKDTIVLDQAGSANYQPKEKLPEGVYVLYFPDQTYLDLLLGADQQFSLTTAVSNMLNNTTITGSVESEQFLTYQKFISGKQLEYGKLQKQLEEHKDDEALVTSLKKQFGEMNGQVKSYMEQLAQDNSGSFISLFIKGLQDVEVPDLKDEYPQLSDSLLQQKRYYRYRNHYFDQLDLTDDRLLRTPFFTSKIDRYFNDIIPQIPDTVASEAIILIEKSRPNAEMFKYVVSYLYNMVNESKIMGMDAALVQIAEKYYLSGLAIWAEPKFVADLDGQVAKIKHTLIGKVAPDLKMVSFNQQYFRLHEVQAPYTILVFWETECGHCKKEIPQLHELWGNKLDHDIKVFCVYTQNNEAEWKAFIEEHHLDDWINVYDPRHLTNFRNLYNITSTPQIFILDQDKKILAKKIGVSQVAEIIDYLKTNKK